MPNLVMLAGVPGSGKSTWARTFFDLKYTNVSADDVRVREFGSLEAAYLGDLQANNERVFEIVHRNIRDSLTHGVDVLADATHLTRKARHEIRALAHDLYSVRTHLVVFKNVQQALARNARRIGMTRVPDPVQERMVIGYRDLLADLDDGERGLYTSVTMIESFA